MKAYHYIRGSRGARIRYRWKFNRPLNSYSTNPDMVHNVFADYYGPLDGVGSVSDQWKYASDTVSLTPNASPGGVKHNGTALDLSGKNITLTPPHIWGGSGSFTKTCWEWWFYCPKLETSTRYGSTFQMDFNHRVVTKSGSTVTAVAPNDWTTSRRFSIVIDPPNKRLLYALSGSTNVVGGTLNELAWNHFALQSNGEGGFFAWLNGQPVFGSPAPFTDMNTLADANTVEMTFNGARLSGFLIRDFIIWDCTFGNRYEFGDTFAPVWI